MKNISKYFNFLFVVLLLTFAGSITNVQAAGLNADNKWQVVKKEFGSETIKVSFPIKPSQFKNDGCLFLTASNVKASFSFIAPIDPIGDIDKDVLYYILMESIQDEPVEIVDSNIFQQDDHWVVEFILYDAEDGMMSENQIHVTNNNFYILESSYIKENRTSDIDKFFNSFKIQ